LHMFNGVLNPIASLQKGQLGHGDTLLRNLPTVVSELSK
jgi:hypothetical protein